MHPDFTRWGYSHSGFLNVVIYRAGSGVGRDHAAVDRPAPHQTKPLAAAPGKRKYATPPPYLPVAGSRGYPGLDVGYGRSGRGVTEYDRSLCINRSEDALLSYKKASESAKRYTSPKKNIAFDR